MTAPIAATYCRISNDPHAREAGVSRQTKDTLAIAADEGWTVPDEWQVVDNHRSASRYARRDREGWTRLIEAIEAGQIQHLVVYDLDRLVRQPKDLERLIDAAEKRGVQVRSATGVLDLRTSHGQFAARQQCNVAAHEAARISERTKNQIRHDALNGKPHWIERPFGFNRDTTHVPVEKAFVVEMYARVIEGQSTNQIARWLNEKNIKTSAGKTWTGSTVRYLIRAPRNAGLSVHHKQIVGKGNWKPIVSEDKWRQACAALDARKATSPRRGGRLSMLTGILTCGRCTGRMVRNSSGAKAAYRCNTGSDGRGRGCGMSVSVVHAHEEVVKRVMTRISDVTAPSLDIEDDGRAQIVADLRASLTLIGGMFGRGEMDPAEFAAAREPLVARLAEAQAALAQTDAHAALRRLTGDTGTLATRWESLDVELQRRIIQTQVSRITVATRAPQGNRNTFDPERIHTEWIAA